MTEQFRNTYIEERASILFPKLEALCPYGIRDRKNGKEGNEGFIALAVEEADLLMTTYPDYTVEGEKTYNTAYTQIDKLKNELKSMKKIHLKDHAFKYSIDTLIKNFTQHLYKLFAVYRKRYNDEYRERLRHRSAVENRIEVDLSVILEKAHTTLIEASKNNPGISYLDVVCAIAITCGRRMSEIMLTGKFEFHDEYFLKFTGQCKGKSRKEDGKMLKDVEFIIPTLVPSELVLAGIDFLEAQDKRLNEREYTTTDVNQKYSKQLSRKSKTNWNPLVGEDRSEFSFHKFRSLYFIACFHNLKEEDKSNVVDLFKLATQWLGDQDMKTVESYSRFNIISGSITKI